MNPTETLPPRGVNMPAEGWQYFGRGPIPGASTSCLYDEVGMWHDEMGRWDYERPFNGCSPDALYCLQVGSPLYNLNFDQP